MATMASAPLRWSLARAFCEEVGGLGGESYDEGSGAAAGDGLGEDVCGGFELEGEWAVALDLLGGGVGYAVKSLTAAAMMTMVASARCSRTAARICSAEVTGMISQPWGGVGRWGRR